MKTILAYHLLHYTIKRSVFAKVQGPDGSLVRIPIMFSELFGHGGLYKKLSEEQVQTWVV
jgi:hypothetical protein